MIEFSKLKFLILILPTEWLGWREFWAHCPGCLSSLNPEMAWALLGCLVAFSFLEVISSSSFCSGPGSSPPAPGPAAIAVAALIVMHPRLWKASPFCGPKQSSRGCC